MCNYIAPLVQNNSGLKKGSVANVIIRDVRIIRNAKWGTKQGVTLLEFIFETQCNHIVVKKIPYSFDDNNEIHDKRYLTHLMIIMRYMIYMKRLQAKVLMLKEGLR